MNTRVIQSDPEPSLKYANSGEKRFESEQLHNRSISQLLPMILNYPRLIAGFVIFLFLASGLTLVLPLLFRLLVDCGFAETQSQHCQLAYTQQSPALLLLVGVLLACLLGVASAARFYTISKLGERVVADLRQLIYQRLLSFGPDFYANNRTGDMIARLTGDTSVVQGVVGSSLSVALRTTVTSLGALVLMLLVSWQLTLLTLILILLIIAPVLSLGRRVQKLSRDTQDQLGDASARASERLYGLNTIQLFSRERAEAQAFSTAVEASYTAAMQRNRMRAVVTALAFALLLSGLILILGFGSIQVNRGELSAGQMAQFLLYAFAVAMGVAVLSENYSELKRGAGAFERLSELLNTEINLNANHEPCETQKEAEDLDSNLSILFDKVSFHYPGKSEMPAAVIDLSLSVEAGQTVAIVGPSGAGKSTLFQLLTGMYATGNGKIEIGGSNINTISQSSLRQAIAVVEQSPTLFSDTILENIAIGKPTAALSDIVHAAKLANAHEFIIKLSDGYNTRLGEHGLSLSGGQRQRLAIARAILKDAPVLLLDEVTSALDAESENLIRDAIASVSTRRTTLVIAHRLSTIRNADKIVFMENGRIVEYGTHNQLMLRQGRYARYLNLQKTTADTAH